MEKLLRVPNVLRIVEGRLEDERGDALEYLKQWQIDENVPDGTPVCVLERRSLAELVYRASLNPIG